MTRRLAALAITTLAVVACLAAPASARDTTWSCPTCVTTHR